MRNLRKLGKIYLENNKRYSDNSNHLPSEVLSLTQLIKTVYLITYPHKRIIQKKERIVKRIVQTGAESTKFYYHLLLKAIFANFK